MKRDYISEIQALKDRANYDSKYFWNFRLVALQQTYNDVLNNKLNSEALKYIPIAIVACLESFFQAVNSELIDHGKPFSDNVIKFNQSKDVKFDFEIVNAIQSKKLTVGEFISHILPCNNLNDINSNVSTITGKDLLKELKAFKVESIHEDKVTLSQEFIKQPDDIYSSIKRTFELRHIFCHEFASQYSINQDEILNCLISTRLFLNQVERYVRELLYPNSPETQTEMNIQAGEMFRESEDNLNSLITLIFSANENSIYSFDLQLFQEMIESWRAYRENQASVDAFGSKGGSMYSLLFSSSLSHTTDRMIEKLKLNYHQVIKLYENK